MTPDYSPKEERLNIITHFLGLIASVIALGMLLWRALAINSIWYIISFFIFGASMVTLYLASTLYHSSTTPARREKLKVFDHSAIYVLIAGTYTPYALISLQGTVGWILFGVSWGLALVGIGIKLFFTGRFKKLSTAGYVLMGWVSVFAAKPIYEALEYHALLYLLLGGAAYTIGAIFYLLRKVPYNHAIFHVWVLLGSAMHFISIYFFV